MVRSMGSKAATDPFLSKQSLSVLAGMGFGRKEPKLGAHKYHGIAARTRLAVAGKVTSDSVFPYNFPQHGHTDGVVIAPDGSKAREQSTWQMAVSCDEFVKAVTTITTMLWLIIYP